MSTTAKKAAALDQNLRAELQALKQIQQGEQLLRACDAYGILSNLVQETY